MFALADSAEVAISESNTLLLLFLLLCFLLFLLVCCFGGWGSCVCFFGLLLCGAWFATGEVPAVDCSLWLGRAVA